MNKTLSPFDAVSLLIDTAKKFGADAAESFGVSATSASADCRLQKTESLEYTHTAAVDLRVFRANAKPSSRRPFWMKSR